MSNDNQSDLIFFKPETIRLFRPAPESATVRLTIQNDPEFSPDRSFLSVRVARAFPFSKPDSYIGIRDSNEKDIGILVALDGLGSESRSIVEAELDRRYFLPVWKRTLKVKEQYGVIEWEMETDRGVQSYALRNIKDSVQHLSQNRVLVSDPDGNRFEVKDTSALDPRAYDVLSKAL